jgi:hypothetical protein
LSAQNGCANTVSIEPKSCSFDESFINIQSILSFSFFGGSPDAEPRDKSLHLVPGGASDAEPRDKSSHLVPGGASETAAVYPEVTAAVCPEVAPAACFVAAAVGRSAASDRGVRSR